MCCPDCKDGLYYPLVGPPENCQTCYIPELGQKPQAEDRMHRKTLAELSDMEKGTSHIHGYSYAIPDEAQLRQTIENKQAGFDAMLQRNKHFVGLIDLNEFEINKNGVPPTETQQLKEQHHLWGRNLNIQGTTIERTKPTEPSYIKEVLISEIRENPTISRSIDKDNLQYRELVQDIGARGILQPLLVCEKIGKNYYELCDGLMRFSAAKDNDMKLIPVHIISSDKAAQLYLLVNFKPSDTRIPTKPIAYANQLKRILRMNPDLSVVDLAEKISKSPEFILRYLDLLDLNPEIQQLVNEGTVAIQTILTGDFAL